MTNKLKPAAKWLIELASAGKVVSEIREAMVRRGLMERTIEDQIRRLRGQGHLSADSGGSEAIEPAPQPQAIRPAPKPSQKVKR